MSDEGPFSELVKRTKELGVNTSQLRRLARLRKEKEERIETHRGEWNSEKERLKEGVLAGEITTGDPVRDYVFANHNSYFPDGDEIREFARHSKNLRKVLRNVRESPTFVYECSGELGRRHEQGFSAYRVCFLENPAYEVTPSDIKLSMKESLVLTLENVFGEEESVWPTVTRDEEPRTVSVKHKGDGRDSYLPTIPTEIMTLGGLEMSLQHVYNKNPLALFELRKAAGEEISEELQSEAQAARYDTALMAAQKLDNAWKELRGSSAKVRQIEERWNPSDAPKGDPYLGATRPVIAPMGPDPVMACLASMDERDIRDRKFSRVGSLLKDLEKTGLYTFDKPLEVEIGAGKKTVFHLGSLARHIGGVTETVLFPKEKEQS